MLTWNPAALVGDPRGGRLRLASPAPGPPGPAPEIAGPSVVVNLFCNAVAAPAVPAAPVVARSAGSLAITCPAFSAEPGAATEWVEVERVQVLTPSPQVLGAWQAVHLFATPGVWADASVAAASSYRYRARACNDAGPSAWGEASAPLAPS